MSFQDLLTPESRNRIQALFMNRLYHHTYIMEREHVHDLCRKLDTLGFRFRGKTYLVPGVNYLVDIVPLPLEYREDFQKHLDFIAQLEVDKAEIDWFIRSTLSKSPDFFTISKLLFWQDIFPKNIPLKYIKGISWDDAQIANYKEKHKKEYTAIASIDITKAMVANL